MPLIKIPENLFCSITFELFKEPVIAEDGHTYEKEAIEKWIHDKGTSPKTREKISSKLIVNWDKKAQLAEFFEKNRICSHKEFLQAAEKGDIKEFEQLNYLESHLEAKKYGMTALNFAAGEGHLEIVKLLLKENDNVLEKCKYSPLINASYGGYIEIVKLLLEAKANIGAALGYAAQSGHLEIVKLLLAAKADVEAKGSWTPRAFYFSSTADGMTALHKASANNHTEIVKLLLAAKANIEAKDGRGFTPLHYAAANGHTDIVKLLLIMAKANIEARDNDGNTALHWAAYYNRSDVVKLLLAMKANIEVKDNKGRTPLLDAAYSGQSSDALQVLSLGNANIEARDNEGYTALHWIASQHISVLLPGEIPLPPHTGLVKESSDFYFHDIQTAEKYVKNCHEQIQFLLKHGADPHAVTNEGKTVIQLAQEKGGEERVTLIIQLSQQLEIERRRAPQEIAKLKIQHKLQQMTIASQQEKINKLEDQLSQVLRHLKLNLVDSVPNEVSPRLTAPTLAQPLPAKNLSYSLSQIFTPPPKQANQRDDNTSQYAPTLSEINGEQEEKKPEDKEDWAAKLGHK